MAQRREGAAAMSAPRVKFQVQRTDGRWRTAYCLVTMLHENLIHMKAYGFKVRVGGREQPA
jgi:hypothetical protein